MLRYLHEFDVPFSHSVCRFIFYLLQKKFFFITIGCKCRDWNQLLNSDGLSIGYLATNNLRIHICKNFANGWKSLSRKRIFHERIILSHIYIYINVYR